MGTPSGALPPPRLAYPGDDLVFRPPPVRHQNYFGDNCASACSVRNIARSSAGLIGFSIRVHSGSRSASA